MQNKRNLAILFTTLVIMMMGFGIIIPILPDLVVKYGGTGVEMGGLMAIFSLMQFLFSPMWGGLSDRFGRKPILILGVFGNAISMVLLGLSTQLWMLFVARALSGLLSSATMPTAYAFISDSTSEDKRGYGMGMLGAAMGVGMVIGPGLGGWMAEKSLSQPFFLAAGFAFLALLFVALMLPESLPPEKRTETANVNIRSQFRDMWAGLFGPIGFLLVLAFLVSFALTSFEGIFGLYSLYRYDYGPQQVGSVLVVIGLVSALAQGMLTGFFTRVWGEEKLIKVALFSSSIAFGVMLLANSDLAVYLTVGFFVLSNAMIRPAVSSLTSMRTRMGQGTAMGLNNSFMSLGRVVGPILAGFLIDINLNLPYTSGAVIMMIGFLLCLFFLGKRETAPVS